MNLNTNKSYDAVLTETSDFFKAQGINILGRGYEEIASNPALFEAYVEQLTDGIENADTAASMAQLMENANVSILTEGSVTGIAPISSLSAPVIRKLWPKFGLKEALDQEVVKTPRFSVSYTAPYMQKGDGEKLYLTRGLLPHAENGAIGELPGALSKEYTAAVEVVLAEGSAQVIDFSDDPHVRIANTPSAAKLQPLDELVFVSVEHGTVAAGEGEGAADVFTKVGDVAIAKRLNVYGGQVYAFRSGAVDGQLVVNFDGKNRKVTLAAIGAAVKVVVKAGVSSEYNEESWDVSFDIQRQDIDIPTGQHLNASLPVEYLNDVKALYQIDGTKETVDLMTNIFAQKLDLEVVRFVQDALANRPRNEAYMDGTYGGAGEYTLVFDCKPAAGFSRGQKEWREELKLQIDHLAQKIKNETFLQIGTFNIVANPLDAMLLSNVDWQFRGGQTGGIDGVTVDYSIGTFVGSNTYKVIASTNVPAGVMYILFLPTGKTQMTYKYYPYTFTTELGYTDPNRSRVPSIMMTKRHTFFEFMPAVGAILIQNNDGMSYMRKYQDVKLFDRE